MKYLEKVVLTVQHEAAKVTRKAWRSVAEMKLAWLYPTKVKNNWSLIGLASDQP